jgi:hypothetical protein
VKKCLNKGCFNRRNTCSIYDRTLIVEIKDVTWKVKKNIKDEYLRIVMSVTKDMSI